VSASGSGEGAIESLYLLVDELPRLEGYPAGVLPPPCLRDHRCTRIGGYHGGVLPAPFRRAHRYTHIACTVPPALVTKAGYRNAHSLTPAAFECLYRWYHQLLVVQELAQLGPAQRRGQQTSLYVHLHALPGAAEVAGMYPILHVVTVIATLGAILGPEHADMDMFASGDLPAQHMDMLVAVAPPRPLGADATAAARDTAYAWAGKHWKVIRTLPSKNCQLARQIPGKGDTAQWHVCLRRVLTEHAGLNWRPRQKGATRFEPTPLSFWAKLGIDVRRYVAWCRSPAARQFGSIRPTMHRCGECDGAGDEVLCLRQNNVWRCVESSTPASRPHRQALEPLDVEQKSGESPVDHELLIRRLLGHVGFPDGVVDGGQGVHAPAMARAWATAVVSEADKSSVLVAYDVDLTAVLADRTRMTSVRRTLNIILKKCKQWTLKPTRYKRNTSTLYTLVSVST
jgi:hypothetical protein